MNIDLYAAMLSRLIIRFLNTVTGPVKYVALHISPDVALFLGIAGILILFVWAMKK